MRRPSRGDAGQVTVFVLGLVAVALVLVAVVANVSRVFLCDRALSSAADGAAAAAARAVEPRTLRGHEGLGVAELSPVLARAEVERYVAESGLTHRFGRGFAYAVDVADGVVTVTLRARATLAFVGPVAGPYRDGVGLEATASARSVLGE